LILNILSYLGNFSYNTYPKSTQRDRQIWLATLKLSCFY